MATVLIAAGGTGGHIAPALAVAELLTKEGLSVHWVGTGSAVEETMLTPAGIKADVIQVSGLRNRNLLTWLVVPWMLLRACWQSWRLLARVRPVGVLGMGGYVAGPIGLMAWVLRVPLLIHEQNADMGWSNRLLRPFARKVLTAFRRTAMPRKFMLVGNPVGRKLLDLSPPYERLKGREGALRVLVLGGSQGSLDLNDTLAPILARYPHLTIWHQSGERGESELKTLYRELGVTVRVEPFMHDMKLAYSWADVVICRAGAITIAELCAVGVASILVPLRGVAGDHQVANAELMYSAQASYMFSIAQIQAGALGAVLADGAQTRVRLEKMACIAYDLRIDDAAERTVATCRSIFRV